MPTVCVRGIDLYYEEYGHGPHLLMAHGLLASVAISRQFGERPEQIAGRGVHVVAYDARGHGRSGYTRDPEDYHWSALAEDMHALVVALGIAPATIYGGSMGAGTALMLALTHPDDVERLILMAPPPLGEAVGAVRRTFGGLALLYRFLGPAMTARIITALPPVRRAQLAAPGVDLRSFLAGQRSAAIVPAIRGLLHGPQIPLERLGDIHRPALILAHPDDPLHPLSSGEALRARLPHATLIVVPTATHWQEHPDALSDLVAAYSRDGSIRPALAAAGAAGSPA